MCRPKRGVWLGLTAVFSMVVFLNFTFGVGLGGLGISACVPPNSQADELLTDTEAAGAAMGEGAEEAKGGAAEEDDLEVRGRAWGFGSLNHGSLSL